MFIPDTYVPLADALVDAFAIKHADAILAAGLQSQEAKRIAGHWLARERLKKVGFHARYATRFARSGRKMVGVVPPQLTPEDHAAARETPEIKALLEKGAELRPLLKATWDDLRTMLSAGQMMGQLIDADTGKHHKIEAHEWNRDDAGIAHITGWFSIPHAWGRFEGPSRC